MSDERLRALHERLLARRRPADRTGCPGADALVALVERRLPEARRVALLDHVMGCLACREDFDLVRAFVEQGEKLQPKRTPSWLPLAAAAVLAVGAGSVWLALRPGGEGPARGGGVGLELVAPSGAVSSAAARRLVWRAQPDAVRYDLEVLDGAGTVLHAAATTDTTAAVPQSVALLPGIDYRWWVVARLADGSERRAEVRAFRVAAP